MRTIAYGMIIASVLVALVAFATTSVMAQTMTDPNMMNEPATTDIPRDEFGGSEPDFSGEAKSGASQEEKARDEMKARAKTEEKAKVSQEPKADMAGEREDITKGKTEAGKEVGKKPEAQSFREREPGTAERKDLSGQRETAEKAEAPRQAKAGEATVASIDSPDNCLRIRGDASASSDIIGCAAEGETLHLTGVFSRDGRWAQLDNNGWVFFDQLRTDVRPPETMASESWESPAARGEDKSAKKRAKGMQHHYGGCSFGWYPGHFGYGY